MDPNEIALIVVSAALAAAWIPVGVHFWKSWKHRGSPLSLAICAMVGFPVFTNISTTIFLTGSRTHTVLAMIGTNLLLLLNFMICFKWQKERFPDARSLPSKSVPAPDFWSQKQVLGEDDPTPPRGTSVPSRPKD